MSETPYPQHLIKLHSLRNGTQVLLRPIKISDADFAYQITQIVSKESLYERFQGHVKIDPSFVHQATHIDYDTEMAIVAEVEGKHPIIAIARYKAINETEVEFGILIADHWHGQGLGFVMTQYLMSIASMMSYKHMSALMFSSNKAMAHIFTKLGFELEHVDYVTLKATISL